MPVFPLWIWAAAITVSCGFALWKGGPSERWAGGVFYAAWLLTLLVHNPDRHATQWAVFLVDVALLAALIAIALVSHRFWPIFMAGFHLLDVITHVGNMVDRQLPGWAYHTAAHIWGYLMILALGVGAWNSWRQRAAQAASGGQTLPSSGGAF